MRKLKDVYIVNAWEAIQWMMDPTPLNLIDTFTPWLKCKDEVGTEKKTKHFLLDERLARHF